MWEACRKMKRAKQILARLPHSTASSTNTGAPLAPAPMSNTPPPSPRIPDTGRSRTPLPDRLRSIGMPSDPQSEPSSPVTPPPSPSPPLRTVYVRFPAGPMKGNPPTNRHGQRQRSGQRSHREWFSTGSRYLFFHRCKTKRQRFRSQREKERQKQRQG